jgi:hypothetical protein
MSKPPLPQPQPEPAPITSDQYLTYTPEKLELYQGFYNYGGQDFTGFYLAVLTNIGLRRAVELAPLSHWVEALQTVLQADPRLNFDSSLGEEMMNHLQRGLEHLRQVADFLESAD